MAIRFANIQDVEEMRSIYAPYVERTTVSFEYTPPTPEAFAQRFQRTTQQFPWLVWEEAGILLGYAYADRPFEREAYAWCAEASVYLRPQAQRRGIGKKLYAALEEILTAQGYATVYAVVTSENAASLAFHEKMGYRHLASFPNCGFKQGHWLGVEWLEKRLKPVELPSKLPEPFWKVIQIH